LILVLFLPTLAYWPTAIGKEAWMLLAIGLGAYGVAGVFRRRPDAYLALVVGMAGMLAVRPHIALIMFIGIVVALLLRKAPARSYAAPLFRLLGLVALLVLGLFLASQTASFFGQESLTSETVNAQLSENETQTGDGGSEFTHVKVNTPIDMVPAFVTVFFRPFPFEVSSPQELASAAEGLLLLGLLVASRKRLRSVPRMIRTTPYVAFCIGYMLAFVFAFSSFANFGILARQRVQALPFLLVFLALPRFQDLLNPPDAEPTPAQRTEPTRPVGPTPRRRSRRPPREVRERVPVSSGPSFPPPARLSG
jgi:hypothetical protein